MFALYINPNTKQRYDFNCESCLDGATKYQTDKIIRNMVRCPASLYTMNLATCNVYNTSNQVNTTNWNQSSDRNNAHIQTNIVPSRSSSTKHTITRARPGAGSPGGSGVDVKHGSYDRYLARKKGKSCSKNMVASCNTTANYETNITNIVFEYSVGDFVWALRSNLGPFYKAQIMSIVVPNQSYVIQFINDNGNPDGTDYQVFKDELLIYTCGC